MFCKYCGKEIKSDAVICVFCGARAPDINLPNDLAVVSFICGLAGIVLCCGFIIGIPAIIIGIKAMKAIKKEEQSGTGFAISGIVLGSISIIIDIIFIIYWTAVLGIIFHTQ